MRTTQHDIHPAIRWGCVVSAPLAIDLCCGLGGWTEGLLAEGWRVRGYDIEAHEYGEERYPAELVVRNVLEMHGSELADADLIVASPPCTEYSYMAMPWSRAKQIARGLRGEDGFPEPYRGSRTVDQLNAIFDACFRLQREASQAAGRHIPMVVENVKGAQPWVGRAKWSFGSFYLWGDVPALMPSALAGQKFNPDGSSHGQGSWFAIADSKCRGSKNKGGSWFNIGSPGQKVTGRNPVHAIAREGVKNRDADGYDRDHPDAFGWKTPRTSSGSKARKQASAQIAKIPLALSSHIARVYRPESLAA
jgi:hypothetical protein